MHARVLLSAIFLLSSLFLFSQEEDQAPRRTAPNPLQPEIDKAQAAFDLKKYNSAAQQFVKVYGKLKDQELRQKILFRIAESYRRSNNFKMAIRWYEEVISNKYPDPNVIYSYGQLLKNYERYDEASRQFYDYLFEVPEDPKAKAAMQSCVLAQEWKANPAKFNVNNIKELNTEFSDYAPCFSNNKLYWSSSRKEAQGTEIFEWTGQKCSDIFEAQLQGQSFYRVNPLKGLVNTNFNDGAAWVDSSGTLMYYTQCNGGDGRGMNCKIYSSRFKDGTWGPGLILPFCRDSFSCGQPYMSPDGRRLFFSSDMPGGFGEKDIYYINYDAATSAWGNPVNLGGRVNSPEDDMFPGADGAGNIYYASKGWMGMGGLDLFTTHDSAGTFAAGRNMKYPVNSGGDDFNLSFVPVHLRKPDGAIAYFSSNREGGAGDDDLYALSAKPFIFIVKGRVLEREGNQPLAAANVNFAETDGKPVFGIKTNEKGEFTAEMPLKKVLNLNAGKEKFFSSSPIPISTIGLNKDSVLELTITLESIPAPEYDFTLQGIYYDLDKWDLRPESKKVLDSLAVILNANLNMVIEIGSHTDSRATSEYNIELSNKRAKSCVDYLIQKGTAKDRLQPVGYGETKLVNDCSDGVECNEEEHQQNRRTTFRVLRTDYKLKR